MVLLLLIILHILGDFYFQTNSMVEKKRKYKKYVLIHSVIYSVPFAILFLVIDIINNTKCIFVCCFIIITHFIIDLLKLLLERRYNSSKQKLFFFVIDQVIHCAVLYLLYKLFQMENFLPKSNVNIEGQSIPLENIVIYGLMILIIIRPSSIIISKVFCLLEPQKESSNTSTGIVNAGTIIGILERLITMLLILVNQYSVLGLVLAAKSIARFKQFDEKEFAEKYLTGTLLSLSIAFVVTIVFKKFLV